MKCLVILLALVLTVPAFAGFPDADRHVAQADRTQVWTGVCAHVNYPALIAQYRLCNDASGMYRLDMTLLGATTGAHIRAEGELPGYTNFYLPHCPDGITGVKEFSRIVYENVYNDIDLELFSSNGRMKYNFIVRPGSDPNAIRMHYNGASETALAADGALAVATPLGCEVCPRGRVSRSGQASAAVDCGQPRGDGRVHRTTKCTRWRWKGNSAAAADDAGEVRKVRSIDSCHCRDR